MSSGPSYQLIPAAGQRPSAPTLDEAQQRVVDHTGGPLLVLAGPGTGKTTTLVEAIVDRVERRGDPADSVLALTFSRKAAEQLRDRVTARLGRTTSSTMCSTFHSFAYALIRRYSPAELYAAPLRLLSAPEQDVVLRELLRPTPEAVAWPASLAAALHTRGFAKEVHGVLGRAREKGLDPHALTELGAQHDLPEFVAAGLFMEQYLTNLDNQGATDYADLIRRAAIEAETHRAELRQQFRHVFVDEYQDTDPGQVALLQQLAGDGGNLTVVGDPHQSIYAFRGAEVRGIFDFPSEFPQTGGASADVVALRTTRRFGPRLLTAAQRIAGRLAWSGSIPAEAREAFLAPQAEAGDLGAGRVQVVTFDTDRSESEHLADLLRRAHLEDGIGWDEMAVLVRSGRASIPALRRSLGAAGVPVEVAAEELPLMQDPAVAPLLDALRAVLNLDNDDPESPDYTDPERAIALLQGPLGGLDAGQVRALGRSLRQREKALLSKSDNDADPVPPRTSRELLRLAAVRAGFLDGLDGPEAERARALNSLLQSTRADLGQGASAEEVLWTLWSGTSWPLRLRRAAESGGAAARRANRDLDSLVALFETAAKAEEQRDHQGVRNFVATMLAQQIPADTLADRGVRGSAVRLLTAHRSKGLEWRLVVVAHVQQEGWPDLRRRSTLLQADRIGTDGLVPPVSVRELLMEERRLFYVACTRARQRLVVTAVASADDEGEQPSRFLAELGVEIRHVQGRPVRPLSMAGLVAELRRTVADPGTSEPLRAAAARRLARLAREEVGSRPLVPQADPSSWWGTRSATRSVQPLRPAEDAVPISASVLQSLMTCPMHWFLEREAGGIARAHQAANVGQLVHALAERVATEDLPAEVDALMEQVDGVWGRLEFRTPWSRAREYDRVRSALTRFVTWHTQNPRRLLGTEVGFRTEIELDDGERVLLAGFADRLELDAEGHVVVVDLKTGRSAPSNKSVLSDAQLGLYQYAVGSGAVDDRVREALGPATEPGQDDPVGVPGGAELVQLGDPEVTAPVVVQPQAAQTPDGQQRADLRLALGEAASILRAESFPAVAGDHCERCAFVSLCPVKSAGTVLQ